MKLKYLVIAFLIGCAQVPTGTIPKIPVEVPSDVVITGGDFKFAWSNKDFDKYLVDAINTYGENLLAIKPADYRDFIDVYPTDFEGVAKFWGNILVMMSKYESSWDPSRQYKEKFKSSSTGN